MTIKSIMDEDFGDWQVRDLDTGEILDNVEYADDETGLCIIRTRYDRGTILRVLKTGRIKLEDKRIQEAPAELDSWEDELEKGERMLKWFRWEHLADDSLREMAYAFQSVAYTVVSQIEKGPERTVALRKLLEAKDAAIRALVNPGG